MPRHKYHRARLYRCLYTEENMYSCTIKPSGVGSPLHVLDLSRNSLVKETEENFKQVWAIEGVCPVFPKHYPTSALLGCVDIHDCLRVKPIMCLKLVNMRSLKCLT